MRLMGGIACFNMWIKMFYWMRVFSKTAHFVTLIGKTISDIKVFILMLTIILIAFANFFYTINNNTYHNPTYAQLPRYQDPEVSTWGTAEETGEFTYLNDLAKSSFMSAIANMYLLMFGEFYVDGFRFGPNEQFAWIGFVLATFIVLVVFMNLLIAIMGETFNNVKEKNDESLLTE